MRIWSLHPKYLDSKGLVALWRETLLARHVLEGRTRGYRQHPQLIRFSGSKSPVGNIHSYLESVYKEAVARGYAFDESKFNAVHTSSRIPVTEGQVQYEFDHLKKKLRERDPAKYREIRSVETPAVHPLFRVVKGEVEEWEVLPSSGKKSSNRNKEPKTSK
jgi:hypothetical protein